MRFAILHHTGWRGDHYDFMLESGSILRTWTIRSPEFDRPQAAEANADHRTEYLNFEGEISGGRGKVRRVAGGTYDTISESERELVIELAGRRLRLSRLEGIKWEIAAVPESSPRSLERPSSP